MSDPYFINHFPDAIYLGSEEINSCGFGKVDVYILPKSTGNRTIIRFGDEASQYVDWNFVICFDTETGHILNPYLTDPAYDPTMKYYILSSKYYELAKEAVIHRYSQKHNHTMIATRSIFLKELSYPCCITKFETEGRCSIHASLHDTRELA